MLAINKLSLTRRLIISNLIVVFVVLPLFSFALINTFSAQAELSEQQTMQALSYELLAKLELENGELSDDITLTATEFSLPGSGLYAFVRSGKRILWESSSVLFPTGNINWVTSSAGKEIFTTIDILQQVHFNWQIQVILEQAGVTYPFTVNIIKSNTDYEEQLRKFNTLLWPWLIGISILFAALQCIWVLWFRQPMRDLAHEIEAIEKSKQAQIHGPYPPEISTVNDRLNQLLNNEKLQRERYKNKLADLAHSLKTPLAVMSTHDNMPSEAVDSIEKISAIINHQLKKAQGKASSWHKGCDVKHIVENLIPSLEKLYATKNIQFTETIDSDARFYGEEEDLYELLGNLLENACKACRHKIAVAINNQPALTIVISDDGVGISDAQKAEILQRGHRADTYDSGQGIGLSVVQDIVNTYQGSLTIEGSGALGGATFTVSFNR